MRRLQKAGGKAKLGGKYSAIPNLCKNNFGGRAVIGSSDNEAQTECLFLLALAGENQITEHDYQTAVG